MMDRKAMKVMAAGILAFAVVVSGCSRKQVETDADRDRTPPPVVQDETPQETVDPDAARREREAAYASIGEMIFFDFDRSELKEDARETLRRKAETLRRFPEIAVRIEGHADERGTVEYNLALGERRAEAARTYLIDLGIDPDRLTTISYGEERPLVQGSNEAAWSQNRRDEFIPLGS